VADLFAPFHETRPWLSTPWRDRAYLAQDFQRVFRRVLIEFPDHPVQSPRLFDPDELNEYSHKR